MSKVFVLDTNKRPLTPIHPGRARILLTGGKAAVFRRYPFTIILKHEVTGPVEPLRLKVDPGSKVTGIALVQDEAIVFAAEIEHRGQAIKKVLDSRRSLRRGRRNRKTRYRQPRFLNRKRSQGWLPPSLESWVQNVKTWVNRLGRLSPVGSISLELVKFDTQKLQNPEISGAEYQRGELFGYEAKEYLLEKFKHTCAYCGGLSGDQRLEVDHYIPRNPKWGPQGTDRISNLTIACQTCNKAKGNLPPEGWLKELLASPKKIDRVRAKNVPVIGSRCKMPLKDAAAVNTARWALFNQLKGLGLPLETGSGGRTKFNRVSQGYQKAHWIDAACVGESGAKIIIPGWLAPMRIKAVGHGNRQRCGTDKYGFPFRHALRAKTFMGYRTGDIVEANIPRGKYAGCHIGRIIIRHRPSFGLNGFDVHPKHLKIVHHADGYNYAALPPHG